jgi:hypothetical protein
MNELDRVWARMIDEAAAKAQAAGQTEVAEYLTLKATNDTIRAASVEWLFDAATEIAAESNRRNAGVTVEQENPHQFAFAGANIVGSLLNFRQGVRCLTLEAGWTRTPADGFMRGGALACARITHFGIGKNNAELVLLRGKNLPNWFSIEKEGKRAVFDSRHLNRHFRVFLGAV